MRFALLIGLGLALGCRCRPPLDHGQVIDVHTHVFNAKDLPVEGFLEHALGQPEWLAAIVADALELFTTRSMERASTRELTEPELREALREILERREANGLAVGRTNQDVELMLRGYLDGQASLSPVEAARFAELESELQGPGAGAEAGARILDGSIGIVLAHVRWAHYLTHTTEWIAERMLETYPQVQLFTPLMMDLGPWFVDSPPPARSIELQLEAAARLVQLHRGRIHPFVSFDPQRQVRAGNALSLVQRGIASGMIGVKLYPPLGYLPAGNPNRDLPGGWPAGADRWDAALAELYDYCAREGVPLTAHCSNPGAEAREGRGLRADPKYWRPVLERYRAQGTPLRLNLNHAGGLQKLITEGESSWAWTIGELIEAGHTGLYADIGHLDEILDPSQRGALAEALKGYFERFPAAKQRLMFGSDWHMLVRRPGHGDYLDELASFLDEHFPELKTDILHGNAMRFLGLEPGDATWRRLADFYDRHDLGRPAWWVDLVELGG